MTDQEVAEQASCGLIRAMNSFSDRFNGEKIVTDMLCEHPTLQQSFMRSVVIPFIKGMAEKDGTGACDLRNARAVSLAKKMLLAISEDGQLPGIPMI